jgi:hypothetical protein
MMLTPRSIETLIDLVEIKLSCLEIMDRDDRREMKVLKQSLAELQAFQRTTRSRGDVGVRAAA